MFSNNPRLNLIGIDDKMLCQVNAETQAIEEGAGNQHAIMPRAGAGNISKRIRGVGYDQYDDGGRRRAHDTRNDVAIDLGVLAQQPQSAPGSPRSVAPPAFSLMPAVIITSAASARYVVIAIDNCRLGTKQ
jgi:hypothetical protein